MEQSFATHTCGECEYKTILTPCRHKICQNYAKTLTDYNCPKCGEMNNKWPPSIKENIDANIGKSNGLCTQCHKTLNKNDIHLECTHNYCKGCAEDFWSFDCPQCEQEVEWPESIKTKIKKNIEKRSCNKCKKQYDESHTKQNCGHYLCSVCVKNNCLDCNEDVVVISPTEFLDKVLLNKYNKDAVMNYKLHLYNNGMDLTDDNGEDFSDMAERIGYFDDVKKYKKQISGNTLYLENKKKSRKNKYKETEEQKKIGRN
jgi:hypothetical protein